MSDDTWLITGCNRGIGLGLAEAHVARGGRLIAALRQTSPEFDTLHAQFPDRITLCRFDLRDGAAIAAAAERVTGPVDVLACNGAVYGGRGPALTSADPADILDAIDINALGPLRLFQAFRPHLAASARPRMVAVSSLMGTMGQAGPGSLAYRTSKAALNKLMQTLAVEARDLGIAMACLRPGYVSSEMTLFRGTMTPQENAPWFLDVIDSLTLADEPLRFIDKDGSLLPW